MSERKVLNKYYPPDFDPSKIPKLRLPKNRQYSIRIMAPFNMRCNTCGEYIYKGKKFNSRKETVETEDYLGLKIFRFYIKCPRCVAEIAFKTDPEKTDYELEGGATRNFEAMRTAEMLAKKEIQEKEQEEANNPMKVLENRTKASQQEMEMIETLEELRDLNSRNAKVDHEDMVRLHQAYEEQLAKLQDEEDENFIKQVFGKSDSNESVKRIKEEEEDGDIDSYVPPLKKINNSIRPTDILKKARNARWKPVEINTLFCTAISMRHILLGKRQGTYSTREEKEEAWMKITARVNAVSLTSRNIKECKDKVRCFGSDAKIKNSRLVDKYGVNAQGTIPRREDLTTLECLALEYLGIVPASGITLDMSSRLELPSEEEVEVGARFAHTPEEAFETGPFEASDFEEEQEEIPDPIIEQPPVEKKCRINPPQTPESSSTSSGSFPSPVQLEMLDVQRLMSVNMTSIISALNKQTESIDRLAQATEMGVAQLESMNANLKHIGDSMNRFFKLGEMGTLNQDTTCTNLTRQRSPSPLSTSPSLMKAPKKEL